MLRGFIFPLEALQFVSVDEPRAQASFEALIGDVLCPYKEKNALNILVLRTRILLVLCAAAAQVLILLLGGEAAAVTQPRATVNEPGEVQVVLES